ncbi:putative invertase inhibitor [Alnus glutinosa]|uniref:putative invertase inhibitor n=1 Tax=Alnus glutinosa TaxID=3517 RepID=UPI002D79DC9D|nr:putative invertase inhibitor [Alnus glutinosa]
MHNRKMRRPFSFFCLRPIVLLFFFMITALIRATNGNNLIHKTCKTCAQSDPNLSYAFCVTSLEAVPSSCRADLRQLGNISIKLTRHNVTKTRHRITKLLEKKKLEPFVRGCLNDCFELYSDVMPSLKQALKAYKAKRYKDANIAVGSVIDASSTCEDGFTEKEGVVSPLTKTNNDTFQLAAMALSIINLLSR